MKKFVLSFLILAVVGGAAYSFNPKTFPSPINKGNILISPTLNLGSFAGGWGGVVIGGSAALDYALPVPLMVGAEVGFAVATAEYGPKSVPILARISWHPNFEVKNLDVYLRVKLGYNIGFGDFKPWPGSQYGYEWGGGFSGGGQLGVRYFFSKSMGVFGELGYDRYGLNLKYTGPSGWGLGSWGYAAGAMFTWFHAGVTFKI